MMTTREALGFPLPSTLAEAAQLLSVARAPLPCPPLPWVGFRSGCETESQMKAGTEETLGASAAKRQRLLQHINAAAAASTAEKAGAEGPPEAAVRDDEARANGISDIKVMLLLCHPSFAPS